MSCSFTARRRTYGNSVARLLLCVLLGSRAGGPHVHADPIAVRGVDTPQKARSVQAAWAQRLKKPLQWTNSVGMKFQLIPPGEFTMAQTASGEADDALRVVRITRPFYLGTVEVTESQWEKVTGRIHSLFYPGPENPITYVSWQDAQEFLAALNKQESATYRLPTEGEWEFAARGGSKEDFVAGSSPGDLDRMGWFHDNSNGSPHAVGAKSPNAFGLHDMLGNVWEWCQEVYAAAPLQSERSDTATQPSGHQSAACYRIVRGGSFLDDPSYCRVWHRDYYEQSRALKSFGFRVALSLQP